MWDMGYGQWKNNILPLSSLFLYERRLTLVLVLYISLFACRRNSLVLEGSVRDRVRRPRFDRHLEHRSGHALSWSSLKSPFLAVTR